ncbi:hypothetical protein H6G89_27005 [Oscillatoria sp. FACHB-1407]|uniref:hypothetical protein n=1 Tax=Oscillatoria sp. FACHB-1407 TaxID=2692847 RepID=UPI0016884CDA|nr:hypothetical protein [Oscillatoria sp. FACHB-1407]MBD2464659.1 hypothetical protein [Oscillatoria sp. FACHB-1407]
MTAPTHFDAVIQGLSQDQNVTRIKKLLLYLCRNQWESNVDRLNQVNLHPLVQDLLHVAPDLEQLRAKLSKVVKSLNKPAEYALVANAIINHLKPLYTVEDATQVISAPGNYDEISALLEQDPQHVRIKKILFCACNGRWENDPNILASYSLEGLVERLHTLTPSLNELSAVLYSIVKTLNRQAEYTLVANTIVEAFTRLYPTPSVSTRILFAETNGTANQAPPPVASPMVASPPTQQVAIASTSHESSAEFPKEPPNLFDLRIEVMKYTSPLRAKALLFSALYRSVDATGEGWAVVRSHDLDELLQSAVDRYPSYELLEVALKDAAKALSDSKQYLQAAGAVLRAVRSWYHYMAALPKPNPKAHTQAAQVSRPPQPPPNTAPILPIAPSDKPVDDTCSFLPPPVPSQPLNTEENQSRPLTPPPLKLDNDDLDQGDRTLDLTPPSTYPENGFPKPQ